MAPSVYGSMCTRWPKWSLLMRDTRIAHTKSSGNSPDRLVSCFRVWEALVVPVAMVGTLLHIHVGIQSANIIDTSQNMMWVKAASTTAVVIDSSTATYTLNVA